MKELPTPYQQFIYKSRYARYLWDEQRREDWPETVSRYISFFEEKFPDAVNYRVLEKAILNLEVMPSMRCMMTAGPALERDNVAGYNCAYVAVSDQKVFDEILYILMCGTGVGFSVERQYINQLPEIPEELYESDTMFTVSDSKRGWASGLRQLISLLYSGTIPKWDLSRLRPAGSPLKTFGGRSSGPEPLEDLFKFTVRQFKQATGRRLSSVEVHDLVCKIADVVVCGGVRRSALLSLSNLTDERMRHAKSGDWHLQNPQRALANNSVCYTETPDMGVFLKEWSSLYTSKSGERGIFSRNAVVSEMPARRDTGFEFGTNPCSEIILRSKQFCNLSEVVVRPSDTVASLRRKVRLAAQLGTLQSMLTDFKYLSKEWKRNTEEERLLGVSLTGIMDLPLMGLDPSFPLEELKKVAIDENKRLATKKLGCNVSAAVTCVKPSGTVSQLVDSSSGIHPRYAPYYIRRVRLDKKDPLGDALIDAGVPYEEGAMNPHEWVFEFPIKAPDTSVFVDDLSAVDQLEHWSAFNIEWCEHKPSVSVYVREHEWLDVAAWVYRNFEHMSGVSFFPYDDHVYRQAPYEKIDEQVYYDLVDKFPASINFDIKEEYDTTSSSQELACSGGACEL